MKATLVFPAMLKEAIGTGRIRVKGDTLGEALEDAYRQIPVLRHHLCEESGRFRSHVLCFLRGSTTRDLGVPLREGDEITIVQAISGG